MTPLASRTDSNQRAIVDALRRYGCTVEVAHTMRHGFPDLIIGHNGRNFLLEVKDKRGSLTPDQVVWHQAWRGQVVIVRTIDEAITVVNGA
jgi:hypothetical protein